VDKSLIIEKSEKKREKREREKEKEKREEKKEERAYYCFFSCPIIYVTPVN